MVEMIPITKSKVHGRGKNKQEPYHTLEFRFHLADNKTSNLRLTGISVCKLRLQVYKNTTH